MNATIEPITFPWSAPDPFLFCVHHHDNYPRGNEAMGPAPGVAGRRIGMDFSGKDGWSMYHGEKVPGFPRHPHRGFETITVVRRGAIDHADSLGATARFGDGDAQWMTAGSGIVHAEMFPLQKRDAENHMEFFQIWLNLPQRSKMVPAHFTMMWKDQVPVHRIKDAAGRTATITTVAGALNGRSPATPPPDSWASQPESDVALWTIDLEPGTEWTLPAAQPGSQRSLYFYGGESMRIGGHAVPHKHRVILPPDQPAPMVAGPTACQLLLLQGRPLGEPVARHGPFVMNTRAELQQAYDDYHRTGFGGWPWPDDAPVHAREQGRFAIHADGKKETPA